MERKKVIRAINERNQVTIPARLLERFGLHPGDFVAIDAKTKAIFIMPAQIGREKEDFTQGEWAKLKKFAEKEIRGGKYTAYPSPKEAKTHIRRLR